ncbi:hypothetical protein MLD38_022344 [Melastoma candidum]|uniref:Uncharacterized protein n=1 Tax=Melastoma candidum TaxID=119954 RepID=A0ACB9QMC5_9MYRT|nr:hypothetical protein MLD38_022344 [Melastoma candidum]
MEKAGSLLFACLLCAWVRTTAAASAAENVFLLAGQSNMAGRGGVRNDSARGVLVWDGFVPVECQPDPRILQLSLDLEWIDAREPLHREIDANRTNGVGPGMAFAHKLLNDEPRIGIIGLVPCAFGGSKITHWLRGGRLYTQMIKRAEASVRLGGRIRGLLWFQGGADTDKQDDADCYRCFLLKFFTDVREDLGIPDLPIIQVAIAPGKRPFSKTVRKAQLSMNLTKVTTLDSKNLPVGPDNVHLTTKSQVILGQRFAKAYINLTRGNPGHGYRDAW